MIKKESRALETAHELVREKDKVKEMLQEKKRLRVGKVSASSTASERKKVRATLSTTTEQLSELDKETESLSYAQDENLSYVYLNLNAKHQHDCFVHYEMKETLRLKN